MKIVKIFKIFIKKHVFFSKFWVIRLLKKKFPISMRNYIFQCSTSVHNLQQKGWTPQEGEFIPKNKKKCVCGQQAHLKNLLFSTKICFKIKISGPFVRCTSYGETTIYITCFQSISFAANNMAAVQRSWMSQLYFEIVAQSAIMQQNPPKNKKLKQNDVNKTNWKGIKVES